MTCPGCQRVIEVPHKMCPAWGTPFYMSGRLFTEADEAARDREVEEKRVGELFDTWWRDSGRNSMDPAAYGAEAAFRAGVRAQMGVK